MKKPKRIETDPLGPEPDVEPIGEEVPPEGRVLERVIDGEHVVSLEGGRTDDGVPYVRTTPVHVPIRGGPPTVLSGLDVTRLSATAQAHAERERRERVKLRVRAENPPPLVERAIRQTCFAFSRDVPTWCSGAACPSWHDGQCADGLAGSRSVVVSRRPVTAQEWATMTDELRGKCEITSAIEKQWDRIFGELEGERDARIRKAEADRKEAERQAALAARKAQADAALEAERVALANMTVQYADELEKGGTP